MWAAVHEVLLHHLGGLWPKWRGLVWTLHLLHPMEPAQDTLTCGKRKGTGEIQNLQVTSTCITTFFSFWAFSETLLFLCISSSIIWDTFWKCVYKQYHVVVCTTTISRKFFIRHLTSGFYLLFQIVQQNCWTMLADLVPLFASWICMCTSHVRFCCIV